MAHVRRIIPLVLIVFSACALGCGGGLEFDDEGRVKIVLKGETFWLEIADDEESIRAGLMHRDAIPEDGGMLFVFPAPRVPSFWMKNCLVDIDVMYLDASGRVLRIYEMKKEPPRRNDETEAQYESRLKKYPYDRRIAYAIELQGGMIEKLGIETRDKLDLDMEALKTLVKPADQAR